MNCGITLEVRSRQLLRTAAANGLAAARAMPSPARRRSTAGSASAGPLMVTSNCFREWADEHYTDHSFSVLCKLAKIGEQKERLVFLNEKHGFSNDYNLMVLTSTLTDEQIAKAKSLERGTIASMNRLEKLEKLGERCAKEAAFARQKAAAELPEPEAGTVSALPEPEAVTPGNSLTAKPHCWQNDCC